MMKGGTWKFVDLLTGAQSLQVVTDSTPSKIKAAFDAAKTLLSPADLDKFIGYDPSGRPVKYSGTTLKQNFTA